MAELNFDAEALALFKRLGVDQTSAPRSASGYNSLDPIFTQQRSGGTIYVGNQSAASDLKTLQRLGVTHVVNCTAGMSCIPCYHRGTLQYLTFDIADWQRHCGASDAGLAAFVAPLFAFIDAALAQGGSVLVHCLAGAHRAGTTGVACLMHYGRMLDVAEATAAAKRLRRVIDPIGRLPEFLKRLLRVELAAGAQAAPAAGAGAGAGALAGAASGGPGEGARAPGAASAPGGTGAEGGRR